MGGYGTTLGQLLRRDYPTYEIGLQLNLPLRNQVAQADAVRDALQVKQTQEVRRQQHEDRVGLQGVLDASRKRFRRGRVCSHCMVVVKLAGFKSNL